MPGAERIPQWVRRHKVASLALAIALLLAIASATEIFLHSRYLQFNAKTLHRRGILGNVVSDIKDHTLEWGELAVNVPSSRLPASFAFPLRVAGFLGLASCAVGIWTKRRTLDMPFWYFFGFASIVLAYPWFDTRLWLPVLPLLMAYVLAGIKHIIPAHSLRPALIIYCSLFCLLGLVSLGYSTRLTFAGARFPDLFGDGTLRATYRLAFLGEPPTHPDDISPDALYLLRRYEWRLSPK